MAIYALLPSDPSLDSILWVACVCISGSLLHHPAAYGFIMRDVSDELKECVVEFLATHSPLPSDLLTGEFVGKNGTKVKHSTLTLTVPVTAIDALRHSETG